MMDISNSNNENEENVSLLSDQLDGIPMEKTVDAKEDARTTEGFFHKLTEVLNKTAHFKNQMVVRLQKFLKEAEDRLNDDNENYNGPRAKRKRSRHQSSIRETDTPKYFIGELRDYQKVGYRWLKALYLNGANGILADEMGLGKTVQAIAFICDLYDPSFCEPNDHNPILVCVPLSTISNWCREFQRFAPKIPVIKYHGKDRHLTLKQFKRINKVDGHMYCPVIIASYQTILNDAKLLRNFNFTYFVLDEAHRIKNHCSKLHITLKSLNFSSRLLMTGTPLQNNLIELWALLNFLMPTIFNNYSWFVDFFDFSDVLDGEVNDERKKALEKKQLERNMVERLHDILGAFMLRRNKENVGLSLPAKKELIVYCPMTSKQRHMYQHYLETTLALMRSKRSPTPEILEGKRTRNCRYDMKAVLAIEADDSEQCTGSADADFTLPDEDDDIHSQRSATDVAGSVDGDGQTPLAGVVIKNNIKPLKSSIWSLRLISMHPDLMQSKIDTSTNYYLVDESLVTLSGKMLMLDKMLPALKKRGHRVLLFSQCVLMLDLIADYCEMRQFKFCRLFGRQPEDERQINIDRFDEDKSVLVFLISTRAGGLGLNLMAADTVIFVDSDWNPQMDMQAQDRCHRLGQTRPVVVYRLASKGTIDERVIERARQKRRLEKLIIKSSTFSGSSSVQENRINMISLDDLKELLESVDHQAMYEGDECAEEIISKADLDRLLDRSDMLEQNKRKSVATPRNTDDNRRSKFRIL